MASTSILVKIEIQTIDSFFFRHPFTLMIAGPTSSGKSTILQKIIDFQEGGIRPCPEQILYCYSIWQPLYDDIRKKWGARAPLFSNLSSYSKQLIFHEGIPQLDDFDSNKRMLLILDDLMDQCGKEKSILDIFTKFSHHKNISVIYVAQNIFCNGKNSRTISLNCQYMILTNNPRDRLQVKVLGKQMFPNDSEYFTESYNDAVSSKKFGYLVLDMSQETENENRIQTGIFINDERIIYRKK